jgi:hypothetical protein
MQLSEPLKYFQLIVYIDNIDLEKYKNPFLTIEDRNIAKNIGEVLPI